MDIKRSGSQPSGKGPAEYFTGTVRVDPLSVRRIPRARRGASVTFEPVRSQQLAHPSARPDADCDIRLRPRAERGAGRSKIFGRAMWCGSAARREALARCHCRTTAMTHIAIQEATRREGRRLDGKSYRRTIQRRSERKCLTRINKQQSNRSIKSMYNAKAYSAASATSRLASSDYPAPRSHCNTMCRSKFCSAASAIPICTRCATSGTT